MDERTLAIIKAMAKGYLNVDEDGRVCHYCCATEWEGINIPDGPNYYVDADLHHEPDCPINLARITLREQGTPVNVYRIRYESCANPKRKNAKWHRSSWIPVIATKQEEVTKEYADENTRNIQVEFICEVPLQG